MKCSFCDLPLACKSCGKPFRSRSREAHIAVFQPDMEILCPECGLKLKCKSCGYVYGDPADDDEPEE